MPRARHQPRPLTPVAATLGVGALVATLATACLLGPPGASATGAGASGPGASSTDWEPPPHTVVAVSGSRDDGFTVKRYDDSTLYPPTLSEARAECAAYSRRVRRVACQVEVRTWYRDLGDLKRSLRWAASVDVDT